MFNMIWFPTSFLVSMARHSFAFFMPIIFIIIFFFGISSFNFFALLILLLIIRGIIIIRGSYILPYSEFNFISFQSGGKESSSGIYMLRAFSFATPIIAFYLLFSLSEFSFIFFSAIILIGPVILAPARVSSIVFLPMFFLCNASALIVSGIKAGMGGIFVCLLLIMTISLDSFASHVSLKNKNFTNQGFQADAAEPRG